MKNLKISSKLIFSFGLVILFLIISMGVSIFNLQALATKVNYYSTQAIPVINAMWQGRRGMVATERAIYKATTSDDRTFTQQCVDDAEKELSVVRDILVILKTHYSGDMADVEEFETMMYSTVEAKEKVYDLLLTDRNQEALAVLTSEYTPVFVAAGGLLSTMAEGVQSRIDMYSDEAEASSLTALVLLVALALIGLAVSVVVCILIVRSLTGPIREIEAAAVKMSEGDLDITITYDSRDELGNLANKIRMLTGTLKDIIMDEGWLLSEMSSGNFDVYSKKEERYVGAFSQILMSMRGITTSLSDTLSQINQAADQVSGGSDQVSSGAQALSQGATEQASSVQELAATITEISDQVRANASNAEKAKDLSNAAGREMAESSQQMREMIQAMNDISNSSNEIGKIIKTIEDIAFQTNILALNAAVEAARAGAAGKGFAVVADEVRNLANKSQEASKNTSTLIETSLRAVENGTRIADQTAHSLLASVESSKQVTNTINGISAASAEQAQSIAQVTQGVDQISAVVQTNSATAEESAAASEELSSQAQMLKSLVGRFILRKQGSTLTEARPAERVDKDYVPEPAYSSASSGGKY